MKFGTKVTSSDPNLDFCYDMLRRVSRSFALVIQQLPQPLRDAVCIFYLVLRALDTVEDDMAIPQATKIPLLRAFHTHIYDPYVACRGLYSLVAGILASINHMHPGHTSCILYNLHDTYQHNAPRATLYPAHHTIPCHTPPLHTTPTPHHPHTTTPHPPMQVLYHSLWHWSLQNPHG